jgi:hypothetical protein
MRKNHAGRLTPPVTVATPEVSVERLLKRTMNNNIARRKKGREKSTTSVMTQI